MMASYLDISACRRSSTAERLSCKQGVTGSSPVVGSTSSASSGARTS